jgi:hypothetical protein
MSSRCCGAQDGKDGEDRGTEANHRISALREWSWICLVHRINMVVSVADVPNGAVVNGKDEFD